MERVMNIWKPIVLLLLLGGCATGSPEFRNILQEDVRQAKLMAEQSDDQLALKCWSYLEGATATRVPSEGELAGVLSAYQKARDVRRAIDAGVSDQFKLECGPMLLDSRGALRRLAARVFFF